MLFDLARPGVAPPLHTDITYLLLMRDWDVDADSDRVELSVHWQWSACSMVRSFVHNIRVLFTALFCVSLELYMSVESH